MVMVQRSVAMRESEAIRRRLYCMAAIIGAEMLLYMLGVTWSLLRAYRKVQKLSNEDQTIAFLTGALLISSICLFSVI